MPNRNYSAPSYRYGYNGKEKDDEVKGGGAQYDYGFRIYDPRLGKFLSVDPLMSTFPWWSPYHFAGNMPIWAVDLDGQELKIVIFEYTSEKVEPVLTVKIYEDIVFDAKNKQPESVINGKAQLAATQTYVYYNRQLVSSSTVYEPVVYPSGLKASANYDYTDDKSMEELGKDNLKYLKKNWTDPLGAVKNVWDRDHIATDYLHEEEGFSDIVEASFYVVPYLKHTPKKGVAFSELMKQTISGPAKFITRKQGEITKLTVTAWEKGITSVKNANWRYYKFEENIGASAGKMTKYMRVEKGTAMADGKWPLHGHPVPEAEFIEHTTIKIDPVR